jgi:hypothetical protein
MISTHYISSIFLILFSSFHFKIKAETQNVYMGLTNSTTPQSLKPHEALASGDQFGQAVAIWDDLCLVSATKRAVLSSSSSSVQADIEGVVYTFKQNNKRQWYDTGAVLASSVAGDGFGHSVSIYEVTAAIGAPFDDLHGIDSGLAYVYYSTSSSNGDNLLGNYYTLQSEHQRAYDYFGYSVAVVPGESYYSHGTVLVGAYGHDWDGRMINSGAVFVFANSGTAWFEVVMLQPSQPYQDGHFGWSLAGYENAIAVGAPGQESAYLFHLEPVATECPHDRPPDQMPSGCQEQHYHQRILQGGDPAHHTYMSWNYIEILHVQNSMETNKGDLFGSSVAVINETSLTVVVGAPYDGTSGTASGAIVILTQLPSSDIWNSWSPGNQNRAEPRSGQQNLRSEEVSSSSSSTSRQLQPQDDRDHRFNIWNIRSNAYTTDKDGTYWMLAKKMTGESSSEHFGQSVAVSDNHVLVGTNLGHSKKGKASLFVFNSTKWQQTDSPIYRGHLYMKEWVKETDLYDRYGGAGDFFGYTLGIHEETALIGAFFTGYSSKWNIGTGGAYIYDAIQLVTIEPEEVAISSSSTSDSNSLTIQNPFLRVTVYSTIVILVLVVFGTLLQTLHTNLGGGKLSFSFGRERVRDLDDSGKSVETNEMTSSHPLTAHEEKRGSASSSSSSLPSHHRYGQNNSNHGTSPRRYDTPPDAPPPVSSSSPYPNYSDHSTTRRGRPSHHHFQQSQPQYQPLPPQQQQQQQSQYGDYGGRQRTGRPAYASSSYSSASPSSAYPPAASPSYARTTAPDPLPSYSQSHNTPSYPPPSTSTRYSQPPLQSQPPQHPTTAYPRNESKPPRTFQY